MEALETLGVDFRIIFVQIVGFLILYWVLNKFLFKRVRGMLGERKEEIKNAYEKNETENKNLARLKEEYEKKIADVESKAEGIIEEGRKKAEALRQEILAQAEKDSKKFLKKSREEIETEKDKAVTDARGQIADISLLVASKLIKKSLSQNDHLQLVDECITTIGDTCKEG